MRRLLNKLNIWLQKTTKDYHCDNIDSEIANIYNMYKFY